MTPLDPFKLLELHRKAIDIMESKVKRFHQWLRHEVKVANSEDEPEAKFILDQFEREFNLKSIVPEETSEVKE